MVDTETLTGTTDTTVTPQTKNYAGFTAPEEQEVTILPDGTAELNYYYTRNKNTPYTVKHWQENLNTANTGTVPRAPTDENKSVNNIENNNPDDVGAGPVSARK